MDTSLMAMYALIVVAIVISAMAYNQSRDNSAVVSAESLTVNNINYGLNTFESSINSTVANQLLVSRSQLNSNISSFQNFTTDKLNSIIGNSAGVNANLSTVSTKLDGIHVPNDTPLLNNITNTLMLQNATLAQILIEGGALNRQILITNRTVVIPPNSFYFGTMLPSFDNHLVIITNQSANLYVMTIAQYYNFSTTNAVTSVTAYTGGTFNFWFNTSENCNKYVYVVNTINYGQQMDMVQDTSVKYSPSAALTGACI